MKITAHVIALLVLICAAYFTLEQRRIWNEVTEKSVEITAKNKRISANADKVEEEFKQLKEFVSGQDQKLAELKQTLVGHNATIASQESEIANLDASLAQQEVEFGETRQGKEEIAKILSDLGENLQPDELEGKTTEIREDTKKQYAKLDELKTVTEAATNRLSSIRADFDSLVSREVDRSTRISRNSLEAVVTAVNQDWGFLVIGAGSNSGFTPQSSLIIQRNGHYVGRVTPSAIEPTQTIAEIEFTSMANGVRIQPGDRVLLAKPSGN